MELTVALPTPHAKQMEIVKSQAKRKIIRAGRRSGKTVISGYIATQAFLDGNRVLYAAPTSDQLDRFWTTVCIALREPILAGIYKKNETEHTIELPGTEQRIRAKTAWNHDTLRGDYAKVLILDEFQLMNEDAWQLVGAPMMLDNNGDAYFIYTPPSLHSRSVSKANDPQHAAKMFKIAKADTSGRWQAFHFTSHDNPYLSKQALEDIVQDMTALSYKMEILAEDVDESPGALWTREIIEKSRVIERPEFPRIVVGVDPSLTSTGDEAGIIVMGINQGNIYVISDVSIQGSPKTWAYSAVAAYENNKADAIIAEVNSGGDMVKDVILSIKSSVNVKTVHASRGKQVRAEPVAAVFENGKGHLVGMFPSLEDELCLWVPGDPSPNRMDAMVWAATELLKIGEGIESIENPFYD